MISIRGSSRFWPVVRSLAAVAGTAVAIVVIMMWLMGVFEPKIEESTVVQAAGRPVGYMPLEVVERIRMPVSESAVGTVRPVHEASVASKLLAKVVAVRVKAGQVVSKGMVLVELDDAELKARRDQAAAAVDAARAARDQAKADYDRIQRLAQQNAAAPREQDTATTTLQAADADLERAEQRLKEAETILSYATIRSPLDGIVVDKKIEVGDMARPGQVLATLYDPTRMQLVARVRESLTHRLAVGQEIGVRIDALDLDCRGQISELVPEAEAASRTFSVKVTGPCPPGVYAGMFGRLMIPLDDAEVLVIPRGAVRRIGQLDVVEVAENGMLQRRSVQLGRGFGQRVQVLSGLREGEKVAIVTPATRTDGGGAY